MVPRQRLGQSSKVSANGTSVSPANASLPTLSSTYRLASLARHTSHRISSPATAQLLCPLWPTGTATRSLTRP